MLLCLFIVIIQSCTQSTIDRMSEIIKRIKKVLGIKPRVEIESTYINPFIILPRRIVSSLRPQLPIPKPTAELQDLPKYFAKSDDEQHECPNYSIEILW